jgi:hypothetical protein
MRTSAMPIVIKCFVHFLLRCWPGMDRRTSPINENQALELRPIIQAFKHKLLKYDWYTKGYINHEFSKQFVSRWRRISMVGFKMVRPPISENCSPDSNNNEHYSKLKFQSLEFQFQFQQRSRTLFCSQLLRQIANDLLYSQILLLPYIIKNGTS